MRTLKNLSLPLLLIVCFNALSYAVVFSRESFSKNASFKKTSSVVKEKGHFLHTATYNGKTIPKVMLPVVTISAERNTKNIVQAMRKGKTTIAVVDLPEVVISGVRNTPVHKLKSLVTKNGIILTKDLPEVVIYAERIGPNSLAWQKTNENNLPVVNLPEVIITANFPDSKMVAVVLYKGEFIPSVTLPVVEITADRPKVLIASSDDGKNTPDIDYDFDDFMKAEAKANLSSDLIILILAKAIFLKF